MSQPNGRPLQEQLDEVHQDMLLTAKNADVEVGHGDADDHLTRLITLLAHGRSFEVQRMARLTLRAYNRVTRYCA